MLERVLLDANAILNSAFISESWSRLVVTKLVQQRKALFVGSRSMREAVEVSRKIARELGKRSDPAIAIEQFVRQFGVVEVHPSNDHVDAKVPKHDEHVVREALTAAATIFTTDTALWAGCQSARYPAAMPLEALRILDVASLSTTIFGVAPGRHRGSIFARVCPGGWAESKSARQATVLEFSGRLLLYYCTQRTTWVCEMPEVGTAALSAKIQANEMQTVVVSWERKKGLRVRASSVETCAVIPMLKPLDRDLNDKVTIGVRANGQNSWNGWINSCVMNDRPISDNLWGELRASSSLTPNPYDSDRLRQAIDLRL